MEVSQLTVFPFLGFDDSSCESYREILIHWCVSCVLPLKNVASLGEGDCSGSSLREIVESGFPSTLRCWGECRWVNRMTMIVPVEGNRKNGDLPWVIAGLGVGLLDALTEKSWWLLFSTFKVRVSNSHIFSICSWWSMAHWRDRSAAFLLRALE